MNWYRCPQCSDDVQAAPGAHLECPHCGHGAQTWTVTTQQMQQGGRPVSQGIAIVALILNIMVWPGLGSLIAGEQIGWAQGFLYLLGLFLTIFGWILFIVGGFIGIALLIGVWIWGIVTGIDLIRRSA
ncbi:MAG: hypothetical protein ACPGQL_05280 [Thermoplasmatota archaeon]